MPVAVDPVRTKARHGRQQALLLVPANGVHAVAGARRQLADADLQRRLVHRVYQMLCTCCVSMYSRAAAILPSRIVIRTWYSCSYTRPLRSSPRDVASTATLSPSATVPFTVMRKCPVMASPMRLKTSAICSFVCVCPAVALLPALPASQ